MCYQQYGAEGKTRFVPAAQLNPSSTFQLESLDALSFIHKPRLRLAEHLHRFNVHQNPAPPTPSHESTANLRPPKANLQSLWTLGKLSFCHKIDASFKSLCSLIDVIVVFFHTAFRGFTNRRISFYFCCRALGTILLLFGFPGSGKKLPLYW